MASDDIYAGRPTGAPIPEDSEQIAAEVMACSIAWEGGARLLGNVRACEVTYLCMKHVERGRWLRERDERIAELERERDALLATTGAAIEHLVASGPCDDTPTDESRCGSAMCTYCRLNGLCSALPHETAQAAEEASKMAWLDRGVIVVHRAAADQKAKGES